MKSFNPTEVLPDLFFDATDAVPQVPVAGIIKLGRLAAENGYLDECVNYTFEGPTLDDLVERIKARHEDLGITRNDNLHKTTRLTWDLVRFETVAVLSNIYRPAPKNQSIDLPSRAELKFSSNFMKLPEHRHMIGELLKAADDVLVQPDVLGYIGSNQDTHETDSYKGRLLRIALLLADEPETRRKSLEWERAKLTGILQPKMLGALQAVPETPYLWDIEALAHHLTLWKPSDALVKKHFNNNKKK